MDPFASFPEAPREAELPAVVRIEYFTDILCIWAYGAQIRIDELKRNYGERVSIRYRFAPLFGDTADRIGEGWRERGGFDGYGRHVNEIANRWDHVQVHPDIWSRNVPASSASVHVFIKAVQLFETMDEYATVASSKKERSLSEEIIWQLRERFFRDAEDIASRTVQERIAESVGLPRARIWSLIDCGEAFAAAHRDMIAKEQYQVPGSPCLVLNQGRQRLYGNVGYRIVEANVLQLLQDPRFGEASWC